MWLPRRPAFQLCSKLCFPAASHHYFAPHASLCLSVPPLYFSPRRALDYCVSHASLCAAIASTSMRWPAPRPSLLRNNTAIPPASSYLYPVPQVSPPNAALCRMMVDLDWRMRRTLLVCATFITHCLLRPSLCHCIRCAAWCEWPPCASASTACDAASRASVLGQPHSHVSHLSQMLHRYPQASLPHINIHPIPTNLLSLSDPYPSPP